MAAYMLRVSTDLVQTDSAGVPTGAVFKIFPRYMTALTGGTTPLQADLTAAGVLGAAAVTAACASTGPLIGQLTNWEAGGPSS